MSSLLDYFQDLADPRLDRKKEHDLTELIVIAIAAVISGAEDWNAIERFGQLKIDWLKTFLKLAGGIPSHDTFNRVFSLLDAEAFGQRFLQWTQSICQLTEGEVVAIDGKALRGSVDAPKGKGAIYLVSAWATGNGLVLGQRKVGEKSNEITAIPRLLEVLVLKGCLVTIDAMGCQKQIAHQIIEQEADYILALKANQASLLAQVQQSFALEKPQETSLDIDLGHGRIEKRTCSIITQLHWVEQAAEWPKLNTLIRIQSHTEEKASGKTSTDCRFFISSLQADTQKINQAIRSHWAIENSLHWCLDVAFQEDKNRTRSKNADQNLAVLRRIALNALKKDSSSKLGLKNKRLAAGWDNNLLAQILNIKI